MTTKVHTADHGLPTSNGWSSGKDGTTVWCGRCKDSFAIDDDWVERYAVVVQKRCERDAAYLRGQADGVLRSGEAEIDRLRNEVPR